MHAHTSSDQISRDVVLPLFIANGVTGIRSMQADCLKDSNGSCGSISAPIDVTNRWRQDIAGRQLIGPRIIAGSPGVNGPAEGESSTVLDPATAEHGRKGKRTDNLEQGSGAGVDLRLLANVLKAERSSPPGSYWILTTLDFNPSTTKVSFPFLSFLRPGASTR